RRRQPQGRHGLDERPRMLGRGRVLHHAPADDPELLVLGLDDAVHRSVAGCGDLEGHGHRVLVDHLIARTCGLDVVGCRRHGDPPGCAHGEDREGSEDDPGETAARGASVALVELGG
ncbi:hypothetical protein ABE10_00385, partial [Bacillus toyonensis]|nr:hypothetical protein [Bacillus toyonensis]